MIRFESPEADDYFSNTANNALRLSPKLHSVAAEIANELNRASNDRVYHGLHLRAWEFLSLAALIEQVKVHFFMPLKGSLILMTSFCYRYGSLR